MKLPKQVSLKTFLGILAIVITLSMGSILYVLAQTPTGRVWITGGIFPHGVITTFAEGSNYFAKDAYGEIQYSGTNATLMFETIIAERVNIFVSEGFYSLANQLYINEDYVAIEFETGTIVNFTGSFSPCILVDGTNYQILKGMLTVFYNDGGATNRVMLELSGSSNGFYEGLYFHGLNASGVVGLHLFAPNGEGITHNSFENLRFWRCATGLLFNYSGSGYVNRNRFYNVITNLGTYYGVRMIGSAMSGNNFVGCEFARSDIGLSYEVTSSGGNVFMGCTWDTHDIIAIDKPYTTHRGLKVLGATLWHSGSGEAVNGSWQWGDHFRGVSGNDYSENVGSATISAGQTYVDSAYDLWCAPYTVIIQPTTDYQGEALFTTIRNATLLRVNMSTTYGSDVTFMYSVYAFP